MSNNELKEAVLAKCGELAPNYDQGEGIYRFKDWDDVQGFTVWDFNVGSSESRRVSFKYSTSEDSPNWPLAAQILGIVGEPQRPSNDLLWEAWWASAKNWGAEPFLESEVRPKFQEWLEILPPDPLQADRELVKPMLEEFNTVLGFAFSDEEIAALKRLAGMGDTNAK